MMVNNVMTEIQSIPTNAPINAQKLFVEIKLSDPEKNAMMAIQMMKMIVTIARTQNVGTRKLISLV